MCEVVCDCLCVWCVCVCGCASVCSHLCVCSHDTFFQFFITCKRTNNANNATHYVEMGTTRRKSSKRNYYIVSPRVIIKASIISMLVCSHVCSCVNLVCFYACKIYFKRIYNLKSLPHIWYVAKTVFDRSKYTCHSIPDQICVVPRQLGRSAVRGESCKL